MLTGPTSTTQRRPTPSRNRHPTLTHPPRVLKESCSSPQQSGNGSCRHGSDRSHGLEKTPTEIPLRRTEKPKVRSSRLGSGFSLPRMGQNASWVGYLRTKTRTGQARKNLRLLQIRLPVWTFYHSIAWTQIDQGPPTQTASSRPCQPLLRLPVHWGAVPTQSWQ